MFWFGQETLHGLNVCTKQSDTTDFFCFFFYDNTSCRHVFTTYKYVKQDFLYPTSLGLKLHRLVMEARALSCHLWTWFDENQCRWFRDLGLESRPFALPGIKTQSDRQMLSVILLSAHGRTTGFSRATTRTDSTVFLNSSCCTCSRILSVGEKAY